jgi:hypothetical protein
MWRQVDTTLKCKQLRHESSFRSVGVSNSLEQKLDGFRSFCTQGVNLPWHLGANFVLAHKGDSSIVTLISANESTLETEAESPIAGVLSVIFGGLATATVEERYVPGGNAGALVKIESIDRCNKITLYEYVIYFDRREALFDVGLFFWGSEPFQSSDFVHGHVQGKLNFAASFQRTCIRGVRRKRRVKASE